MRVRYFVLLFAAFVIQGCTSGTPPKRFGKNLAEITKPGSDYNPTGISANRHVRLLGKNLTYPPANWYRQVSMRNMYGQSEHFQKNIGHRVTLAEVPAGETFEDPTQLYAFDARIVEPKVDGEKELGFLWRDLHTSCDGKLIVDAPNYYEAGSAFFCESIASSEVEGARGAITIVRLIKSDRVTLEVSHTWRGEPFSYAREGSWPVPKTKIEEVARQLGFVQLTDPASGTPESRVCSLSDLFCGFSENLD